MGLDFEIYEVIENKKQYDIFIWRRNITRYWDYTYLRKTLGKVFVASYCPTTGAKFYKMEKFEEIL
jgi:hypothetical protein